ncbi:hypothetical protein LCGC14_2431450 [marine sediment metagenome]|uniref:Uncharacterized protein n=1 Tax=marine sediment metagenome TaxID=412755 RepID=A0A0F9C969_9ZZZZ
MAQYQHFDPYQMMLDPTLDSTFTVKSGVGVPAQQPQAAPAQPQPQGQPNQVPPNMLGLISMLGQYGSILSGGQSTVMGQVGGAAAGQAQNALFNQFLQMLSGGGGQQPIPFNQAR